MAADRIQDSRLVQLKAEAEKAFGRELSAAGLKSFYLNDEQPDPGFYAQLNDLNRQISRAMRSPEMRKLFRKKKAGEISHDELQQAMDKIHASLTAQYTALDKLLSVEKLPKADCEFTDGKLLELRQPHVGILRRTAYTLLGRLRVTPAAASELSVNIFKLMQTMSSSTFSGIIAQNKIFDRWCETVRQLKADKKITDEQYAQLKTLAQKAIAQIDFQKQLAGLIYCEAVFAYDLYRAHSLTTIDAAGAYFRFDRAAALKSLLELYRSNGKDFRKPERGIARMLAVPWNVYSDMESNYKAKLGEL